MMKKPELMLKVGAEGGILSLYRYVDEAGTQRYFTTVNDAALHDLMVGEDLGPVGGESSDVFSLEDGLKLMDQTIWAQLHALHVQPEIAGEVWSAVVSRLASDNVSEDQKGYALERWAEVCNVGADAIEATHARRYSFRDLVMAFIWFDHDSATPEDGKPPSLYQALAAAFDADFGGSDPYGEPVERLRNRDSHDGSTEALLILLKNGARTWRSLEVPWSGFLEVPSDVMNLVEPHRGPLYDKMFELRYDLEDFFIEVALKLYPKLRYRTVTSEDLAKFGYEEPPETDDDDVL